jgi:glutaredoxin-related protein
MSEVKLYGAPWCGDCVRSKALLERLQVDYDYLDVDQDDANKDKAIEIMSFCYTNLKSFTLGFKSPNMEFPSEYYQKNDLLSYVNK